MSTVSKINSIKEKKQVMKKKLQYIAPQTEVVHVQIETLLIETSPGGGASGSPSSESFEDGEDWASREYDDWD